MNTAPSLYDTGKVTKLILDNINNISGPPKISSSPAQSGVVGQNVHINCAAVTVPQPEEISWKYHEGLIDEGEFYNYGSFPR